MLRREFGGARSSQKAALRDRDCYSRHLGGYGVLSTNKHVSVCFLSLLTSAPAVSCSEVILHLLGEALCDFWMADHPSKITGLRPDERSRGHAKRLIHHYSRNDHHDQTWDHPQVQVNRHKLVDQFNGLSSIQLFVNRYCQCGCDYPDEEIQNRCPLCLCEVPGRLPGFSGVEIRARLQRYANGDCRRMGG
jgi:hypothetical protein